ncbi:uncharacterized protein Tco025E_00159 [Trypanosoma conorhini]|uniref:Uncharacterized protein n=1 Tax=Trypanosoma conorhini TaxID=83891 RepID=A0A3R7PZY6_9TRYP|nr:uncharacterized protein Tco025E_00159 [Trypanosoma conorhini]RNF27598.1 hypothetical protein Tco025E_00159 [Trypanosoma conorhini]
MAEASTAAGAGRAGRSRALFLQDEEQFLFDFGGYSAAPASGRDPTSPASCASARPHAEEDDGAADLRGRGSVVVAPLDAAEVRHGFHAALRAGGDVFLKSSLDEAVAKFQLGLQRYGEALGRQARQERQRATATRKSHAGGSNNNDNNSINVTNTSNIAESRKRTRQ